MTDQCGRADQFACQPASNAESIQISGKESNVASIPLEFAFEYPLLGKIKMDMKFVAYRQQNKALCGGFLGR